MAAHRIKNLLKRYREGLCTPEEKAWVESWYLDRIAAEEALPENTDFESIKLEVWTNIQQKRPINIKRRVFLPRIAAAVAIFVLVMGIGYWYLIKSKPDLQQSRTVAEQITPGGNKALLTLADGKQVSLTNKANGELAEQLGVKITKTADGQLIYNTSAIQSQLPKTAFNTIETPIGGQYQVQLPDGTKVWLNASSSLRFPVAFAGHERRVRLTGEGYFEVATDKRHPFIVKTNQQEVKVLGTQFNINSYTDEESIKTTLLAGSVVVNTTIGNHSVMLKPGQQASLQHNNILKVNKVDLEQSTAWKNGYFKFDGDLESIMRQISRWYDVDIIYEINANEPMYFGGKISRSKELAAVLKIIESTKSVRFMTEGRRIIVTK